MSDFTVGASTVLFIVTDDGFAERREDLLRVWDLMLYVASAADYDDLLALWSGPVSVRTCTGSAGATPYVDIAGGAGVGTLTIDNVVGSPFNAALVKINRPGAYPGGGRRCQVTFQECP